MADTEGPSPASADSLLTVHATCVAIDGHGVLLRGPGGAGKSDLALRLIDGGAVLVADDVTRLRPGSGGVAACAPPACPGRIALRGLGVLTVPHVADAPVRLVVDLVPNLHARGADADRFDVATTRLGGAEVPVLQLDPFEAVTPAKIRLWLRQPRQSFGTGRAHAPT